MFFALLTPYEHRLFFWLLAIVISSYVPQACTSVSILAIIKSEMSAEILGMLMCYISDGQMTQFLAESLRCWCDSPNKMEFYTDTLKAWNAMRELQKEEHKHLEGKPLVDPSDVFKFRGNGNGN